MLEAEKKMIDRINKYIVGIAILFVFVTAVWIRIRGCNYIGIDYHFSLYDIPGNCNSYLFREFVGLLMTRYPNHIVSLLKVIAYLGDLGVALLALILLRQKWANLNSMQVFFAVTACLLSPVSLLYSVSGMKLDSVSMCMLLIGFVFCQKGWLIPSVLVTASAAFFLPAYWPIVLVLNVREAIRPQPDAQKDRQVRFRPQVFVSLLILLCLLVLSIFLDNRAIADGYYWGKVFVINPAAESPYTGIGTWLPAMCRIYGYTFATLTLIFSFFHRKLRIPALAIQLSVLALVGWYQTAHFAL